MTIDLASVLAGEADRLAGCLPDPGYAAGYVDGLADILSRHRRGDGEPVTEAACRRAADYADLAAADTWRRGYREAVIAWSDYAPYATP